MRGTAVISVSFNAVSSFSGPTIACNSKYHQRITTWMLQQIKSRQYLVNEMNVDAFGKELLEQTENFNPSK